MILTQYQTREKYGMSITSLQRKAKKVPRPRYFIDLADLPDGTKQAPRIDEDHPEFKQYVKLLKLKKQGYSDNNSNSADLMKVINAVENVITDRYGLEEAREVKGLIILELRN